jgi:hypothetical protein
MDTQKGRSVVTTQVPLAEMQRYTTELARSPAAEASS